MKHAPAATLTIALLSLLPGCTSVWDESYQPFLAAPALRDGEQVTVREIPWQRMHAALQEQEDIAAASDIHWQEWTDQQRIEANSKLLKALQISDDPRRVRIVGVSSFRTTEKVKPWDGELESFAKNRGAHYAVWADRYLGKAETIVTRTVWSDTTDYITYEDATGDDRRATRQRSTSRDVPLVVEKDETGFTAFFLRVE
jgi:hypothetical protein